MSCQNRPPSPACLGPGTARMCSTCRAISQKSEMLKRMQSPHAAIEKSYSREVAQTCDGNLAQWKVNYVLRTTAKGSVLATKVLIHAVDGTASATMSVKGNWLAMVSAVWNNKAKLSVPILESTTSARVIDTISRVVNFEIDWVDSAVASAYDVTCNKSMDLKEFITHFDALPANERQNEINWYRTFEPTLRDYSTTDPFWKKAKYLNDVPRDATRHGTPHLGEWGANDREAVQHEFGHAIGLPDEYLTTKYWITDPGGTAFVEITLDGAIYNLAPFTSPSLMNNTMSRTGAKLFPRHFELLAMDFEDLVSTHMASGGYVKPGSATVQLLS